MHVVYQQFNSNDSTESDANDSASSTLNNSDSCGSGDSALTETHMDLLEEEFAPTLHFIRNFRNLSKSDIIKKINESDFSDAMKATLIKHVNSKRYKKKQKNMLHFVLNSNYEKRKLEKTF